MFWAHMNGPLWRGVAGSMLALLAMLWASGAAHGSQGHAGRAQFSAAVVRTAVALGGRPYQWAGVGPRGFDCSGLVAHVFAALGRPLPHSSFAQFRFGAAIPRWHLVAGDLVFFRTSRPGPSHVGIYIGDGRFVHASYSRGVVVSSIEEPYFNVRFIGGRRI